jgi:molybdopterin-guanine dinucleotide biosynthesis protein A
VTCLHNHEKIAGITAVILAGGRNSRFPGIKGLIRINGLSIIERNLALLQSMFENVLISANAPEIYFRLGARLIGDVLPSRGPMSGIYTALINSGDDDVFVLACDMPFPAPGLVRLLCERHLRQGRDGDNAATIPVFGGKPQPLFGVYRRTVINDLEDAIISDKVCMVRFLEGIRPLYLNEAEIKAVDPAGTSFLNINTPEDYDAIVGEMSETLNAGCDRNGTEKE